MGAGAVATREGNEMGETWIRFKIYGIDGKSTELDAIVDTGATFTKIPLYVANELGLEAKYETKVELGDGHIITRKLAPAEVEIDDVRRLVLVSIGEEKPLLGYTTLELLGFKVNPITSKLERTMAIEYRAKGNAVSLTEKVLSQLLEVLDEKSRAILWHLWWHRHAEISELRDIIDAPGDFEVLHRLKEVINAKTQQLWGKPIVGFEQSKIDPLTGEKVLFSWWFLDEVNIPLSGGHKPLVDVFDEKDNVTVVVKVPTSVQLDQPQIDYRNGILKVRLRKNKSKRKVTTQPQCHSELVSESQRTLGMLK